MIGIIKVQPLPLKEMMRSKDISVPDLAATVGCRTDYLRRVLNGKERGSAVLMKQLEEVERQLLDW